MARPLVPGSASALKPQVKLGWSSNFMKPTGIWISGFQSRPPASIKITRVAGSSVRRLAKTHPCYRRCNSDPDRRVKSDPRSRLALWHSEGAGWLEGRWHWRSGYCIGTARGSAKEIVPRQDEPQDPSGREVRCGERQRDQMEPVPYATAVDPGGLFWCPRHAVEEIALSAKRRAQD